MRAVSTKSCVPADNDPAVDTGQWQGRCFRLHGLACRTGRLPQVWTVTVSLPAARFRGPRRREARRRATRATSRARCDDRRPGRAVRGRLPGAGSRRRRSAAAAPEQRAPGRRGSAGSSRVRIHASPSGVRTPVSDRAERIEGGHARPSGDPRPAGERPGRRGTEDVQVPARELEPGLERIVAGRRHRPDGRLPRPRPPDQHRARRRSVPRASSRCAARARARLSVRSSSRRRGRACRRPARSSALRRPFRSSGNLPSENTARSRAAIT